VAGGGVFIWLGQSKGVSLGFGANIGGYGVSVCSGSEYWGALGVVLMSASTPRLNRS
jgi:hypothetical protein